MRLSPQIIVLGIMWSAVSLVASAPQAATPSAVPGANPADVMKRYGNIVESHPLGGGGLTAWTLERGGRNVVLYSTADASVIIYGAVWDAATGKNLSDGQATKVLSSTGAIAAPPRAEAFAAPASQPIVGAMTGTFKGQVPVPIATLDTLSGIKEGKGSAADTLYIMFDPRCPYCRKAYFATRAYVARGVTIKWVPVLVLGQPQQGMPMAAAIMQATEPQRADMLRRVLGDKESINAQPNAQTSALVARNNEYFWAAMQQSRVEPAGVPVAFFLNKRTGEPRVVTGVQEQAVLEEILGRL